MDTKRIKKILLLLTFILSATLSGYSEDTRPPDTKTEGHEGRGFLHQHIKVSTKKRMPSCHNLELTYENGCLILESETTEGTFLLQVVSHTSGESNNITIAVGETIELILNCDLYTITATDCEGRIFVGEIQIV